MATTINWQVDSLDDVLGQDAPYEQMVREARAGLAELAMQDYPERGVVEDDPTRSWYACAAEMGDRATCRMIELVRDAEDDPQAVYDAAFDALAEED